MIKNIDPLNIIEVREIASQANKEKKEKEIGEEDKGKKIITFTKKFSKLNKENAEKLKQEISNLGILKIKPAYLTKIIDILPRDAEDVRKIFIDVNLDQNEINQIIDTVKKYV